MFQYNQYRWSSLTVQDSRHRTYIAQTGCPEVEKSQPVVGTISGSRQTETENVGRGHQTSPENRARSKRGRKTGRVFVVPLFIADEKRLETKRRHIEHAKTQKTVHLSEALNCRFNPIPPPKKTLDSL